MFADGRVSVLLQRWAEEARQGRELSAEELCRDCPELAAEVEVCLLVFHDWKGPPSLTEDSESATLPHPDAEATSGLPPSENDLTVVKRSPARSVGPDAAVVVPGYEILEELGRGGMGVVYRARQRGLNREVALKMIRAGAVAGLEDRARFLAEAEAVAAVRHPGVVQVYDFGTWGELPYFALEFCPGGSLAARLQGKPLPPREAAQVVEQVARAVQAAHERGIVHRDLKPGNVLLAEDGTPKVTDFGLAKRVEGDSGLTRTGIIVGTPSYMAPEQARGEKTVGPAADVWALGAILYECLTGRPPFLAASAVDIVLQVVNNEPVSARQLNGKVPRDLETICQKCLTRDPARRYPSAGAIADELARYRAGEPIRARPVSRVERTVRWVRRRPALAALFAVAVLAVITLLGLGFWFSGEMGAARGALEAEVVRSASAHQLAQTHEFFGLLRTVEKRSASPEVGWTWANLADLKKIAQMAPAADHLVELRTEAAAALGGIDVRLRDSASPKVLGQDFHARTLAYDPRGRYLAIGQDRALGFALCYVGLIDLKRKAKPRLLSFPSSAFFQSVLKGSQEGVRSLAFSPDGRWLVAGTAYGTLQCWDLSVQAPARIYRPAHKDRVEQLAFTPDGTALFSQGRDNVVKRWSFPALKETAQVTTSRDVVGLAVHPTEGWVCAGDPKAWRLSSETLRPLCAEQGQWLFRVRFSPDGRLALFHWGGRVQLLDRGNLHELRTLLPPGEDQSHDGEVSSLAFSPDGALILSASEGKQARLWETASGRLLADLPCDGRKPAAAFHPDGRSLAVTAGKEVRFYEIGGLREQTFLASRSHPVTACALHPDGRSLACLSRSFRGQTVGEVSVWPLDSCRSTSPSAVHTFAGHEPGLRHPLAFHPASGVLALGRRRSLTLWGPAGERALGPLLRAGRNVQALGVAPGARLWAAVGGEIQSRELPDGRLAARWSSEGVRVMTGASDPNCLAAGRRWVAAGGDNGLVYLLRAADASSVVLPRVADHPVRSVALSADEGLVAAGTDRGELRLLRVPDGTVTAQQTPHHDRVVALAFAGSCLLASGSRDRRVKLWHCEGGTLRELMTLPMPAPVRWLAFHPDGVRLFVLLERERAVRVWHLDRLRDRLRHLGLGAPS
jgi:WD40 repeat protein